MRTNRYPIDLQLPIFLWKAITKCRQSIFYEVTKRTTKRQPTKTQKKNLPENVFEAVKPYFGPLNMFNCTFIKQQ